jgi:GNAT superfamily N-acetyltransferase
LSAVRNLIHGTIDACYLDAYPREAVEFFLDYHNDDNILKGAKNGFTIVLEKNGRIIATGTLLVDHIMRVFVEPAFQKIGLGKLIMKKLEKKALSAGLGLVKLDASLPAKRFYDSLGYTTVEESFVEVQNGQKLNYFKMQKSILND